MQVQAVSFSTGATENTSLLLSDTVPLTEWSPALQKLALLSCSRVFCAKKEPITPKDGGKIFRKISLLAATLRHKHIL
jgi:hypothetical protein